MCVSKTFSALALTDRAALVREDQGEGAVFYHLVAAKRARSFAGGAGLAEFNRALRKSDFRVRLPFAGSVSPVAAAEMLSDLRMPGALAYSSDGKHFVVVTDNGSCSARCYRVLRDPTPHVLGECASR